MNAVTKPRAKKSPAAPASAAIRSSEWVEHVTEVRALVERSLTLTSKALEKVDYGKPAHTLLACAIAEYPTILRYLGHGPVSEEDAQFLNDEAIWPALGMLSGALSLVEHDADEEAMAPVIREAHTKLNDAHSGLDCTIVAELKAPKVNSGRRDFSEGRDLAIALLKAGDELDTTDLAEPYRWMRGGGPQARFALPFLHRLHNEPELLEGFAAVLSARLGTGDHAAPDYFDLPMAEYEAGQAGADGTEVDTGAAEVPPATPAPAPAPAPANDAQPRAADDSARRLALVQETNHEIEKLAEATLRLLEQDRDDDFLMYHGLLRRIMLLSSINFFALRIHGDTPEEEERNWGALCKIGTLERHYQGMM